MHVQTVRGCVTLKKYKSQGKAVEVTVSNKDENSSDFCLDFFQELGLWYVDKCKINCSIMLGCGSPLLLPKAYLLKDWSSVTSPDAK
jgi:hypothetical protein